MGISGSRRGRAEVEAWAQANITTRARKLLIKIFYLRRPSKRTLHILKTPNLTLGLSFFGLLWVFFFLFKSTKTI